MFIEIDDGPVKGKATRIPVEAAVTTVESHDDDDDDAPSKQDDDDDDEDEYDKRLEASAADDKDDEVDKGFIITQSRAECLFVLFVCLSVQQEQHCSFFLFLHMLIGNCHHLAASKTNYRAVGDGQP